MKDVAKELRARIGQVYKEQGIALNYLNEPVRAHVDAMGAMFVKFLEDYMAERRSGS